MSRRGPARPGGRKKLGTEWVDAHPYRACAGLVSAIALTRLSLRRSQKTNPPLRQTPE
jgi:hypothetical protein